MLGLLFWYEEEAVIEDQDFSGEYFGMVTATGRFPSSAVDIKNFQKRYDYYIDTATDKCCDWFSKNEKRCPETYEILKLEIFKHDGQFYLRNKIWYSKDSIRQSFDIPMIHRKDSLIFDSKVANLKSNLFYLADLNSGYPGRFKLLGFSMNVSEEHFGRGRWTFINEYEMRSSGGYWSCTLTALEISNLDLKNTNLVVLSACETGLGDIEGNEGVYGLQRAFKMAGVESIIMSLWQVPDAETSEFMQLFYNTWFEGGTVRNAFNETQLSMQTKYATEPYKWAAFVLVD